VAERLPEGGVAQQLDVVLESDEPDARPVAEAREVHIGEAHQQGDPDGEHAEGDEQDHRGRDEAVRRETSSHGSTVVGRTGEMPARPTVSGQLTEVPLVALTSASMVWSRSAPVSTIALRASSRALPVSPSQFGTRGRIAAFASCSEYTAT